MNDVWNLDPLYKGFDDPAYGADMTALKELSEKIQALGKALQSQEVKDYINNTYSGAVVPIF